MIQDVRVAGQSIQGERAPGAIQTSYTGKRIALEVLGRFAATDKAQVAAVLNNGLDLEVLSVADGRIVLELDTAGVVDLYLAGPHTLRVRVGDALLKTTIQVGSPDEGLVPFPRIDTLTPHYESDGSLKRLEVSGLYFPRNPYFAKALIDDRAVTIESVSREDGQDRMLLRLPPELSLRAGAELSLIYATPFGSFRRSFQLAP